MSWMITNKLTDKLISKRNAFVLSALVAAIALIGLVSNQSIASVGRYSNKYTKRSRSASKSNKIEFNSAAGKDDVSNLPTIGVGAYGDTRLGFIADTKMSSYLNARNTQAGALEIAGGPNVIRANATYGVALTPEQRIKLTYEFLDENIDFNFVSGTVEKWMYQHAVGASYAYLLDNVRFLDSIEVGGYYTYSNSKDLSTRQFTIDGADRLEQRRIAGANSGHGYADIAVRLWPYSRLSGGVDYDIVRYNTKYTIHYDDTDGFGGHMKLEQRVLPQLKFSFNTQLLQTQRQYTGNVSWLMPSPKGMQFELVAVSDYVDSKVTGHRRYFTNGARFNMSLDKTDGTYKDLGQQQHQSLLTWTRTPSVRMATVLAIADSRVTDLTNTTEYYFQPRSIFIQEQGLSATNHGGVCPDASAIQEDENGAVDEHDNPIYGVPGQDDWSSKLELGADSTFGVRGLGRVHFTEAKYVVSANEEQCSYVDGTKEADILTLTHSGSTDLEETIDPNDENWSENGQDYVCKATAGHNCQYYVKVPKEEEKENP